MRRATLISASFHAAIAAAAIAAGMINADELPELDGGIPVSLVAAAPGTQDVGDPGSGSPEPPGPAEPAATHTPPQQMLTPPMPAETAEAAPVALRPNPSERFETVELPQEEPAEPPPPEIELAEAPPEPVATPPVLKPVPPIEVVTPAEPESAPELVVEPTPIEPTPVEAAVSPEATGTPQATSATADGEADGVQMAHADASADGVPTDDGFSLSSLGPGTAADPAVAADYAALLAQWLEHHKEYPERARRRHQQGVVLCEFTITDTGDVMNYRILEGSGHALLDEEVDALIARASPLPPPPPGAAATYRVPIIFALR